MKVKNPNELWVLNRTTSDVSMGDLGVKVPAGKALNIYKANPYLTKAQVETSRDMGSLSKRLATGTLVIVKRAVKDAPHALKQLKESSETTLKAVKTKSSVVIEPEQDTEESGEGFDFADYGVSDIGPSVDQSKQEDGTIVVTVAQDDEADDVSGVEMKPTLESGVSKQSQVVMRAAQEAMTDPTGPHAEASASSQSKPFTVVKPPSPPKLETTEEATTADDAAAAALKARQQEKTAVAPTGETVSKDETGAVVVGGQKKTRSIRRVKKAQEEGTDDYTLPGDDEVGADEVIDFEKTRYDSKVATKTEDGAIVMKLKEEEEKAAVKKTVTKKARPSKKK